MSIPSRHFISQEQTIGERPVPFRVKHYPIDERGFVCQGYFFPFDLRGLVVVLSHVVGPLPSWLDAHGPG